MFISLLLLLVSPSVFITFIRVWQTVLFSPFPPLSICVWFNSCLSSQQMFALVYVSTTAHILLLYAVSFSGVMSSFSQHAHKHEGFDNAIEEYKGFLINHPGLSLIYLWFLQMAGLSSSTASLALSVWNLCRVWSFSVLCSLTTCILHCADSPDSWLSLSATGKAIVGGA